MVYNGLGQRVAGVFYPPVCLLCGAPGERPRDLCSACARELPRNLHCCARCAQPLPPSDGAASPICGHCVRRPPVYRRAFAVFVYAPPVTYLVRRFKYAARPECGRLLSGLFAESCAASLSGAVDCLVPVPLHPQRLRERGFNQAQVLAEALRAATGIPVSSNLVVRHRPTLAQTSQLNAAQRRRNVRGAFELTGKVTGLRIALVDDVLTTGATADELARLLKRGGAADVQVLAVARAYTPN